MFKLWKNLKIIEDNVPDPSRLIIHRNHKPLLSQVSQLQRVSLFSSSL